MKITRDELYRRVWETPVRTLAKEFDISDVGLSKACRRASIPLPPVGYWTKVQHGQKPKKPPLPKSDVRELTLDAARNRSPATQRKRSEVPKLQIAVPVVVTADTLLPFTKATSEKLTKTKATSQGFKSCSGAGVFECLLGQDSEQKVIDLLNAIEGALPGVGASLVKGKDNSKLFVEYGGQKVNFKLSEVTSRTEVVVYDRYYKGQVSKDYVYKFTGQFALTIDGYFEGRKRWTDGKRESLKEKLGDFVVGLVDAAKALKQREADLAAQRIRWAEEARIREAAELHRRHMQAFRTNLLAEANAARESELMTQYVLRLREAILRSDRPLSESGVEWISLAEKIAAESAPHEKRLAKLQSTSETDSYYGYFGRPFIAS